VCHPTKTINKAENDGSTREWQKITTVLFHNTECQLSDTTVMYGSILTLENHIVANLLVFHGDYFSNIAL
jgi:hypothetical protein